VLGQLAHRLATGALTLLLVTGLVTVLIHLAPGGPLGDSVESAGMHRLPPAARAELKRIYHLDQPLYRQYTMWLGDLLRGDLGRSLHDRRPVAEKIGERVGITVILNGLALALMVLFAVPIGAAAAWRPGSWIDRLAATGSYALYAIPAFWAGLLLQIVFAVHLGWLPLAGLTSDGYEALGPFGQAADRIRHWILPVICLSYGGVAYLSRFVRATLLDSSSNESAVAARARGLSALAVLYKHGFRLAAVPMLTLAGFLLPALVGGSVIVETVFSIPGLGRLFVDAAFQRDLPVLLGLTLVSGAATLAGILLADLTYVIADPRVRRG
jgi:peptide/nickel transport system permease protein